MDQVELDASYDQTIYEPLGGQIIARIMADSELVRTRLGPPRHVAYGPRRSKTSTSTAPSSQRADLHLHSRRQLVSRQRQGCRIRRRDLCECRRSLYRPGFCTVDKTDGDLGVMAAQVRRAMAWIYKNATTFDGDASGSMSAAIPPAGISAASC